VKAIGILNVSPKEAADLILYDLKAFAAIRPNVD